MTLGVRWRIFSSSSGLDFSHYEPDEPIRYVKNDAINSAVETPTTLSTGLWTLGRIISRMGLGSRNPVIVGSAEEVTEDLISWVDETDIDGFNLSRIVPPEWSCRSCKSVASRSAPIDPALAREIVRRLGAAAAEPPGRRTPHLISASFARSGGFSTKPKFPPISAASC